MNPAEQDRRSLPRYGTGDQDMTRPCVVLFDWNDDEVTAVVNSSELMEGSSPLRPEDIEQLEEVEAVPLDDLEMAQFRPRWHGVGRRPGAMALAVVLSVSFVIGVLAMFRSGDARAEATELGALAR